MIEHKTVWITGASSGIGEALSQLWSEMGATIILSSRNLELLEKVKSTCKGKQEKITVQTLDLADPKSIEQAVKNVTSNYSAIDCVFLNGGLSQRSLADETSMDVDRKIMEVNYFGNIALVKQLLPYFHQQGRGHFVVTSSLAGVFGFPLRSSYSASKHALHGFFDTLRAEQVKNKILVTLACPGRINSNISINALNAEGSPTMIMDDAQIHGMPAKECARQMINAALKEKKEVYIGRKEVIMAYFKRYIPFIYYKLVSRVKPN